MQPSLLKIPKGAILGQQLAVAARRLVMNSLHLETDKNGCGDQNTLLPPCSTASPALEFPLHQSNGHAVTASPQAKNSPCTAHNRLKRKKRHYKKVTNI